MCWARCNSSNWFRLVSKTGTWRTTNSSFICCNFLQRKFRNRTTASFSECFSCLTRRSSFRIGVVVYQRSVLFRSSTAALNRLTNGCTIRTFDCVKVYFPLSLTCTIFQKLKIKGHILLLLCFWIRMWKLIGIPERNWCWMAIWMWELNWISLLCLCLTNQKLRICTIIENGFCRWCFNVSILIF